MSNHFTGLSLGPPLGDQRLDLCDLYAFQSPADPARTVLILNANPNADALHPDAIYRLAVDNDGDLRNDIAFSYVFSTPQDGRQTVDVYLAVGDEAEEPEVVGERIFAGVDVSFGKAPTIATSDDFTFFAGARSDAFFFDYDGIKNLFDIRGGRNFTAMHAAGDAPWTGVDSNATANVFSIAIEMPTAFWEPTPTSGSGAAAVCDATVNSCTSTGPGIRRSAVSSTPTTPRRSTTPACRFTTANGGSDSSST